MLSWEARVSVLPKLDLGWAAEIQEAWWKAFGELWREAQSFDTSSRDMPIHCTQDARKGVE